MTINPRACLDAIVVGAGVNGLAAAITLARAGHSVRVYEAQATAGGSTKSADVTEPGFTHDVGSTVHALVLASPFFRALRLDQHGLQLVHPAAPFAHPLDDGTALVVERDIEATTAGMMRRDARAWSKLFEPFVERADAMMDALLGPIWLHHPLLMARFGLRGVQAASPFARRVFESESTRALFAGVASHSMVQLEGLGTVGYAMGLVLTAHAYGWPVARGGSQQLTNAMLSYLQSLGGEIVFDNVVTNLNDLPPSRAILCDVSPKQLLQMISAPMPDKYRKTLQAFRYGPGVFKMDWALNGPVPWRTKSCARAGTIHLGGTLAELAASERDAHIGRHSEKPFVLAVQTSLFDDTRAPEGKHTLWAYCHVPNGSTVDMSERIENQVERFAPGFRDTIIARNTMNTAELERWNANIVGGDIAGGAGDFAQVLARPTFGPNPYATPTKGVYLCSSSTPPGIGVHGMCGFHAARSAMRGSLSGA